MTKKRKDSWKRTFEVLGTTDQTITARYSESKKKWDIKKNYGGCRDKKDKETRQGRCNIENRDVAL